MGKIIIKNFIAHNSSLTLVLLHKNKTNMENLIKQKELHEKALRIVELIEKEDYQIKAFEELLDSRTEEIYRGQFEYNQSQLNTKKRALKRLKESLNRIIKELTS